MKLRNDNPWPVHVPTSEGTVRVQPGGEFDVDDESDLADRDGFARVASRSKQDPPGPKFPPKKEAD